MFGLLVPLASISRRALSYECMTVLWSLFFQGLPRVDQIPAKKWVEKGFHSLYFVSLSAIAYTQKHPIEYRGEHNSQPSI